MAVICHLTNCHTPNDIRIFAKECRSLVAHGHTVHLIAPGSGPDEVVSKVTIHKVPAGQKLLGRLTYDLLTRLAWKILKKAVALKADVYHFHDPHLLPVGLVLSALGKRVLYDVHEYFPGQVARRTTNKLVPPAVEKFENFATRRFAGVVAATPSIARRFKALGCKVAEVNNFPMLEEIAMGSTYDSEPRSGACFIGYLSKGRGVREMVEACHKAGVILHIAGTFQDKNYKAECESLPGWKSVVFYGHLDRKKALEVMQQSGMGMLLFDDSPNHLESQPNKMFEYMAMGLPLVASNFPYWRKLIEESGTGLCVPPKDVDAITEAVRFLATNRQTAHEMGRKGQRMVLERFNWESEAKILVSFYEQILNRKSC